MIMLHQQTPESGMFSQSCWSILLKIKTQQTLEAAIQVEAWWNSGKLEKLASEACLKKRKFGMLDYS